MKIGTNIMIKVKIKDDYQKLRSKIMDIDDQTISIDYPVKIENNKTFFLMNGNQLEVSFIDEKEQAYQFNTYVLGRKKENIPLVTLSKPKTEEMIKIQRREFVRIKQAVDVAIHPIYGEFQPFRTVTDDISAGGASIIVPNYIPIQLNQVLTSWLILPRQSDDYNYFKFTSRVTRIIEGKGANKIISVQFLNRTPKEEQTILQYCYEQQFALKQKEQWM